MAQNQLVDSAELEVPTKVVLVDDNAVVRQGLRALLETSEAIDVVGEAGDGVEAERVIRSCCPDVVLLDVRMPRRDGVATARIVSELATVVMLTFTDTPETIRDALDAGASGYLVHGSFDASALVHTVRQAARGSGAFSPQALDAIRRMGQADQAAGQVAARQKKYGLSEREAEIVTLIAQGKSNGQIAGELFLAEKTVKNHINSIFAKLHVQNRGEAIAHWLGNIE